MSFDLYKIEKTVFTFEDYAVLLDEAKRAKVKTVLEFGPGISTLAWIEAGCERIISLEYQLSWLAKARRELGRYSNVQIISFKNVEHFNIPEVNRVPLDLIFIDSPVGVELKRADKFPGKEGCSRLNALEWAIGRAPVILLHDAKRQGEQNSLIRLPPWCGVEMIETTKGFARITPNA